MTTLDAGKDGDGIEPPLRASRSRRRMADWSLVLEAAGIPHHQVFGSSGWELRVAEVDLVRARHALDGYDQETARPERLAVPPSVEPYGRTVVGLLTAIALTVFFIVTGPSDGTSRWSQLGSSAAERIFQGEPWRAATALTLHVDPAHLVGNAVACLVFLTFLGRRVGPGLAIWVALLAGVFGNLLTAAVTRGHHVAVGASTATFGALGGLVGLQISSLSPAVSRQPVWAVLAAAAALLGMLGTSPGADVLAHFFGLLSGAVLGAVALLAGSSLRGGWTQRLLAVAAVCAIALCWALAFSRGRPLG
jgi:membrane associated rhomboid family serine protease